MQTHTSDRTYAFGRGAATGVQDVAGQRSSLTRHPPAPRTVCKLRPAASHVPCAPRCQTRAPRHSAAHSSVCVRGSRQPPCHSESSHAEVLSDAEQLTRTGVSFPARDLGRPHFESRQTSVRSWRKYDPLLRPRRWLPAPPVVHPSRRAVRRRRPASSRSGWA